MSSKLERASIGQGIHLGAVRDPKFKHNLLSASFVLPLSEKDVSDNAVTPYILRKGCRECPDFSSLNARLAGLYGAALDADITKFGGWQVLELSIRGLDNRFALENEDVTTQCAELLASVLLDPKLDGKGLFDEKDTALERQYVLDTIEAQINDKRAYARSQCIKHMCAGEPNAVRRYGSIETARAITPESAVRAYRRMVETAPVELIFVGSGDSARFAQVFQKRFGQVRRSPLQLERMRPREKADKVRERVEHMDLSQSKLVMGMRTGGAAGPRELQARRVFSALYGGTPFSKLFLNVREKLSLCYYCASRFDVSTGLITVESGVEAKNSDKARQEVLRQLKAVQEGGFDETELANTKLLLKNSIRSTGDTLTGLQGWYMAQVLRGRNDSPEEDAAQIEAVTRDEVIEAARAVTLDTVYFLTGNEEEAQ